MKHNQDGFSALLFPLIITAILLIASLSFAFWAYSGRQKYKNNVDSIVNSSVAQAKLTQQTNDNKQYAIASLSPLTSYFSPASLGSITVMYPKTWSSYVNTASGSYPLDGYFYPGTLPSVNDQDTTNFALRIQISSQTYAQVLQQFTSLLKQGKMTVNAYSLPKVSSEVGIEASGQFINNQNKTATEVVLPLRSQTLEIWTEGNQYLSIFNQYILPNFTFAP